MLSRLASLGHKLMWGIPIDFSVNVFANSRLVSFVEVVPVQYLSNPPCESLWVYFSNGLFLGCSIYGLFYFWIGLFLDWPIFGLAYMWKWS
jgi:hypothetical protein